jgi:polysaccharide export outer membrane protein
MELLNLLRHPGALLARIGPAAPAEHGRMSMARSIRPITLAGALAAASLLAACAALPSSGPTQGQIIDNGNTSVFHYRIIDISPGLLSGFVEVPAAHLSALPALSTSAPGAIVSDGDVLSVTIYSIGAGPFGGAGLGGDAGGGDQNSATALQTLPNLLVSEGRIAIPFAGRIEVAGLTVEQIEDRIAAALKSKSIQPQVLVNITARIANAVLIYGDVKTSGRYPLPRSRESLLETIALAGGAMHGPSDTKVIVTRGSVSASATLNDIYALGDNNIAMAPGDRIELQYKPRTFTVFGAAPKVLEVNFEEPHLSLGDAVARVGGPDPLSADPYAIYLFRFETPATARQLGLSAPDNAVIYHVSLMNSDSYFALQKFEMRDGDLIYIANARTNALQKFLGLIGQAFGPAATAVNVSR